MLATFGCVLVLLGAGQATPEAGVYRTFRAELSAQARSVLQLNRDLVGFLRAQRNNTIEYELLLDLIGAAGRTADHAQAVGTLLALHDRMACAPDREAVRSELQAEVRYYLEDLSSSLEGVNSVIANTRMPGISASAITLKDYLRRVEGVLKAIQ